MASPWLALVPAAVAMCAAAYLSYHPAYKRAPWFPAAVALLSVLTGLLWAWVARRAESDRQLYSVGVAWDAVTILGYSLLPLVAFGVRLSPWSLCGLALVVAGACLVKWGG